GRQERGHRDRQEPPRRERAVCQQRGQRQRRDDTGGDGPAVADHEAVPEGAEPPEEPHRPVTATGVRTRPVRNIATRPNDTRSTNPSTPRSAASPPGHVTPAPSAPQNVPKLISMAPTANFIVFSGTRLSGARTRTPTPTTNTTAAPAPTAASGMLPWVLPNVNTMNATSSPSRNTPLNASVNEYQSRPARSS